MLGRHDRLAHCVRHDDGPIEQKLEPAVEKNVYWPLELTGIPLAGNDALHTGQLRDDRRKGVRCLMKRLHNIDIVALDNPGQFRRPPQRVWCIDALHRDVAHRDPRGAHAIDQGIGPEIEHHHTAFESIAGQKSDELC